MNELSDLCFTCVGCLGLVVADALGPVVADGLGLVVVVDALGLVVADYRLSLRLSCVICHVVVVVVVLQPH